MGQKIELDRAESALSGCCSACGREISAEFVAAGIHECNVCAMRDLLSHVFSEEEIEEIFGDRRIH